MTILNDGMFAPKSIPSSAASGCECDAKFLSKCGRIVEIILKNEFDVAITRIGAAASQILFVKTEMG